MMDSEKQGLVEGQVFNDDDDNPSSSENSGKKKVQIRNKLQDLVK